MSTTVLHRFLTCSAFLLVLVAPLRAHAEGGISEVIVLGDSLSDAGNLAALPDFAFLSNPFLPFDDGLSNGPRAVEVLAVELGLAAEPSLHLVAPVPVGSNFAVASARATTVGTPPTIDLPTQLGALLVSRGGVLPADALYVVFIGGNDVRDARDAPDSETAAALINEAVAGVANTIRALVGAGARRLLVANSPDIGRIPETLAAGDRRFIKRATRLTRRFNRKLRRAVRRIERESRIDIAEFDTFRFLDVVIKRAARLGFSNSVDGCFDTNALIATGVPSFHPDCANGANFDSFVFFDGIHPTARVHALAGAAMLVVVAEQLDDEDEDDHGHARGRRHHD